ncbi:MAG: ribose-5-phosphate isomerase A [Candidatus Binatia bacterium]|nr:MAG: ribose-5-phosphate isomerase A [Candidatus Binatia bacterium]
MVNEAQSERILAAVAERALSFVPRNGTVGLGTGRAASAFVRALASSVARGERAVRCIATSEATANLARSLGLDLVNLADVEVIDVTVDGADEVAPNLDLIKGYGGALVREKVVAAASAKLVIAATVDKLVDRLGRRGKLPVEVVPFAWPFCQRRLRQLLGGEPVLRRNGEDLFLSDGENYILDCPVGPIEDALALEDSIRRIPGVVGTGLFLGMASVVLVGDDERVQERHR